MSKDVWVLTREHNEYDQHGAYFEAVFSKQPSIQELAPHLSGYLPQDMGVAIAMCEHVRKGGGRYKMEDVWYNLEKVTTEN